MAISTRRPTLKMSYARTVAWAVAQEGVELSNWGYIPISQLVQRKTFTYLKFIFVNLLNSLQILFPLG